jgi:serine/threonine protein kinase/tetratricopeptide (TPR) repeat protein
VTHEAASSLADALRDRYLIERELGRGGMATVYLARDIRHKRLVALKVLRAEVGAAVGTERFQREIELAAGLQHPHIVTVFDSGEAAGQLWFTMPYIEGESLRDRLGRERQLPLKDALRITIEVARALDYAHRHGVIHRDFKPENILLTADGDTALADLGIARAVHPIEEHLTATGLAIGTAAYMSPEQASGDRQLNARSDIYSLGLVLYEMLAGEPPFTGPNALAVMARRLTESPRSLRQIRETVPHAVEAAVATALARSPADRYATAAEFAQALSAPTDSRTSVTMATPRRLNRGMLTAALGAVALALVTTGLFAWRRSRSADAGPKMLVVLPIKNLGAPADQYFADGLTEEITSRLTGVSGLGVISSSTASRYRNTSKSTRAIGRELGAGYVLEGSVRWERDSAGRGRVRVTPQLIRVSNDSHVWSDRYEADLADVFRVQAQIAEKVAAALDLALRPEERAALAARPTASPEAYDAYLRGNDFDERSSRADEARAIELYRRAVALDSSFAAAWARLGQAEAVSWWFAWDRTPQTLARAEAAIRRALSLDPDLPTAHVAMGLYHLWAARDFDRALAEFTIAGKRQPNDPNLASSIGAVERRQGRWVEAIASFRRAVALDPRSMLTVPELGLTYLVVRDYANAEATFDRAIALAPDVGNTYWLKIEAYANQGDLADARAVFRQASHQMPFGKFIAQNLFAAPPVSILVTDSAYRAALPGLTLDDFGRDSVRYYRIKADSYRLMGQTAAGRVYCDSLAAAARDRLRTLSDYAYLHAALGTAEAYLGNAGEAIREARRAEELEPPSRDHFAGMLIIEEAAQIFMAAGQPDSAVSRLRAALAAPSLLSVARLRIDPVWMPLRGNPGFERLIAGR